MLKESIVYQATDGCKFAGCLYRNEIRNKRIAIFIHGSNGNFFKLKYTDYIADELLKINMDFLSADNRGREQYVTNYKIVDGIKTKIKIGTMYEDFNESLYDIAGMIQYVRNLGYEDIILIGESLGTVKVLNYCQNYKDIDKIVLLSPVDMILRFKNRVKDRYNEYVNKANELVAADKPYELLTDEFSAIKIATTMEYNTPSDILRLENNRDNYIIDYNGHVSVVVGTDDHCSKDFGMEYLNVKLSQRFQKAKYTFHTIEGANHSFHNYEDTLATIIAKCIQKMIK